MNPSRSSSCNGSVPPSLENSDCEIYNGQGNLDFNSHSANDDVVVRASISRSIRQCTLSREQIADGMTALLGVRITEPMLNTYSASSTSANRLPAAWIRAFCRVTQDDSLLRAIAEGAGYRLIRNGEIDLLELGREYLRQKRAAEQVQELEKRLSKVQL